MDKKLKKIIENSYNIKIEILNENVFYYNNEKIYIYITDKDSKKINDLFKISNYLYSCNIRNNTFIYNKNNEIFTKYNEDKNIVLMKINERDKKIYKDDIVEINVKNIIEKYDIKMNWKNEIDEYEQKIKNTNSNKYYDNYYIGIAENALQLINNYNDNREELCHKIKLKEYIKINFYNPFNYINTNYFYDLSNYIKYKFINDEIEIDEIDEIIKKIKDNEDKIFFYSVLMYPNYYFESNDNLNDKIMKKYEKMLENCKNELNDELINNIEWIK